MPKVTFRNIEVCDLETIRMWRNSPNIARNMFSTGTITEEQQLQWYESICRGERGYCWFVESESLPVGYASLIRAERAEDTYEFGLYIGNPQFLEGGYGSAILFNLLEYGFVKLNAHKIICEVLSFNMSAIKLYERFGLQKQGYFKDFLKRGVERIDCISYVIFNEEWKQLREDLSKYITSR